MQESNLSSSVSPIRVAIISTGVQCSVMEQARSGYVMTLKNGQVNCTPSQQDSVGRGTELALCLVESEPEIEIVGIDIFAGQQRTNSTLLLSALEKALSLRVDVIACCVQSFNADKAEQFQTLCARAAAQQITIVASSSDAKPSFPGSLTSCVGVLSHVDCLEFMYFYDPEIFGDAAISSGLFMANGWWQGRFWGAEMATIRVVSQMVSLRKSGMSTTETARHLQVRSHLPIAPFGFS